MGYYKNKYKENIKKLIPKYKVNEIYFKHIFHEN